MDYTLAVQKTGDSLVFEDSKSKYLDYELQIINKIILLVSGYDSRPFFETNVEENHIYPIGVFPDIITIPSTVNLPHISSGAIKSLLKDITHFGSAVHLLFKLQDSLEGAYIESQDPALKPLPPSLIVLMLEESTFVNGHVHGPRDSYDWYWKEDLRGFCKALNILLDDWHFIMFRVQEKHFKDIYSHDKRSKSSMKVSRNVEEMKSPFMEIFENHYLASEPKFGFGSGPNHLDKSELGDRLSPGTEEISNRILNMYVNLESFVMLMENLGNLIELFLNYMNNKSLNKQEMSNAMITLLLMKLRASEMTNDRKLTRLWKYLLYYTFKDRKDFMLTLSTDNIFSIFEHSVEISKEVSESINVLDVFNAEKNLKMLFDDELSSNLFRICTMDSQSIEVEFFAYLNSKFKVFVNQGIKIMEKILNEKYKYPHYLHLLSSIALSQLGENMFKTKTMAREKSVKSLLNQAVIEYVRDNNSILSNLTSKELEGILSTIKIEMNSKDKYMISVMKRNSVILFENDTLKIYSEIFNHMTDFLNFKKSVGDQVMKYKWTAIRDSSEYLIKILLLMTHIVDCLKTYYSMLIEHFVDSISKPKYGTNIDVMKNIQHNKLIVLRGFLLVPIENIDEIYWNKELKKITELFRDIFQISYQFSTYSDTLDDFNDEVYNRLKGYFDEIIFTMDIFFIDDLAEYDKWTIFKKDRKCIEINNNDKETLHSILATFKNLLAFNQIII